MKNILKNIGLLVFTGVLFTACDEDDFTGASQIDFSAATVTLSSLSPTTFDESAIDEDDASTYEITIEATLSEAQPTEAVIDLMQVGGSANGSDFHAGTITIPAGGMSASATVEILQTGDIEGDETLSIGGKARANFNVAAFEHMVTIENDYINTRLDLSVTWEGEVTIEEEDVSTITAELCAIDFDFLLFDAVTFTNYGYLFASGSCPEEGSFGIFDGSFILVAELYANPHSGFGDTTDVPITVNWDHEYFDNSGSITVPNIYDLSTSDASYPQAPLVIINVSDGGETWEVLPY